MLPITFALREKWRCAERLSRRGGGCPCVPVRPRRRVIGVQIVSAERPAELAPPPSRRPVRGEVPPSLARRGPARRCPRSPLERLAVGVHPKRLPAVGVCIRRN